jgi:hypothetical protein
VSHAIDVSNGYPRWAGVRGTAVLLDRNVFSQFDENRAFRVAVKFLHALPGSVGALNQRRAASSVGQPRQIDAHILIRTRRRRPSHLRADTRIR